MRIQLINGWKDYWDKYGIIHTWGLITVRIPDWKMVEIFITIFNFQIKIEI